MVDCLTERLYIFDDFLPGETSGAMRADIDAHFSNPYQHKHETHDVWNYGHVPGQYNYLRTTPEKVIGREKVEQFVEALRSLSAVKFGFAEVTWPFFGLYVPGCSQNLHNDATNGQLGYVYSLTRNDRQTIGGETMVVHDRDLFRTSLRTAAAGRAMFDLVEPRFNRLTLFDDRVPHAVQRIDGSMDPVEGRLVLHGHISEAGVVAQGALTPAAIQESVTAALAPIREGVAPGVRGPLVYKLDIAATGEVQQLRPILDRLASSEADNLDDLRRKIVDRLSKLSFPQQSAPTWANVPLIF